MHTQTTDDFVTTADGLDLVVHHRTTAAMPTAAIVVVHGFTASGSCPEVGALADALHGDDYDVVTYDARGHGGSPGASTLGDDEQYDVAAAVERARTRTDTVVVVGASMGAIATLRYAAGDADLAGVVAVSCPAAWRLPRTARAVAAAAMTRTVPGRMLTQRLTGVRVASRWTDPSPPVDCAAALEVPVTYVHGTDDRFIPARDAAELYDATRDPRRLRIVRGMGHAFGDAAIDPIRDAVAWALSGAPLPR